MVNLLLVGVGGFVGSVLRYLLSGFVQHLDESASFPFGTLAVNLLGCLIIGFLSQLADSRGVFTPQARLLVFVGMLGGFTTFSTFTNETFNLLGDNDIWLSLFNVSAHLILGLGMIWLGRAMAHWTWR